MGLEIVGDTTVQFTAFQQKEFARWKKVIEDRKITPDLRPAAGSAAATWLTPSPRTAAWTP
jgi:hypothetical protein